MKFTEKDDFNRSATVHTLLHNSGPNTAVVAEHNEATSLNNGSLILS